MKKILVCCHGGATSSALTTAMNDYFKENSIDIKAFFDGIIVIDREERFQRINPDLVLLAPQVTSLANVGIIKLDNLKKKSVKFAPLEIDEFSTKDVVSIHKKINSLLGLE